MVNRVSVCLDELAPTRGAFVHAQEWAERLRVPLFLHDPKDPLKENVRAGTSPGTLYICGRSLSEDLRAEFLGNSARTETPRLLCPEEWQPLSRMLVVHEESGEDEPFIRSALRLCDTVEARPIVLTVSHSERVALRREEALRGVLAGQGLHCEFAQFAGPDVETAVLHVASWRRCQVIVLKERSRRSWWPWRGADRLEQLMARPSPLACLVLPEGGIYPVSGSERCSTAAGSLKPGR